MIPVELILNERKFWVVNHRLGCTYPGYLMMASKENVADIRELSAGALAEIGPLLANLEKALIQAYSVTKVVVAKHGFSPGFSCHFHIVPVHGWIMDAIAAHPAYANDPDGNDVMLYANRELCEKQEEQQALSIARKAIADIAPLLS